MRKSERYGAFMKLQIPDLLERTAFPSMKSVAKKKKALFLLGSKVVSIGPGQHLAGFSQGQTKVDN